MKMQPNISAAENIKGQLMKKSLKHRILYLILGLVLLLNILSISMNYQNFVNTTEHASYSAASTVAETCALTIDGDSLSRYIQSGQRDSSYYVTWNKLIDYRNTSEKIIKLSVAWFHADGGVYIYDTDLSENGAFLGDRFALDAKQLNYLNTLTDGNKPVFISYSDRMEFYRPIFSSYNLPMGYVVVGISTAEESQAQALYLIRLVLTMAAFTLLVTLLFMHIVNKSIVLPINQLAKATSSYNDSANKTAQNSPLAQLSIHTGDEIENLYYSIRKMESDILNSSDNLAIAMWNSQHDSMTQLYNKFYLSQYTEEFETKASMGVIYFDVDNLKKMNDLCGHEAGDTVIKKTADFIRKYQGRSGKGIRMGGDEFVMLLPDFSQERVMDILLKMKADPDIILTPPDSPVQCRIAIGYVYKTGSIDLSELIKEADQNMYLDKQSHR